MIRAQLLQRWPQRWRNSKEFNAPNIFAGVVCLIVLVLLIFHLWDQHRFVRSDDALVQGHFTTLSAKVPGRITEVYVDDHDLVKKGQVLARIDRRDYENAILRALHAKQASQVKSKLALQDLERARVLHSSGIISDAKYEAAKTTFDKETSDVTGDEAKLSQAEINSDYADIVAPGDGVVAIRAANPGMEVKDGDPLFGWVYPDDKWIEAKIKETDLSDLHLGETVDVTIDALPGRDFKGELESLSPTTEGLIAAILPDNSAGNFTKYVQRLPVKVALKLSPEDQSLVRIGLSANIKIKRRL